MTRLLLLISITLIFVMGLVMIFSTSSAEILDHDLDKSTHQALLKQILYAFIGIIFAVIIWKLDYHTLLKISPLLLIILSILLFLTLLPGIGKEVNGSKRWIGIFGFSFQPSEFVKYVLPAYFLHKILVIGVENITFKIFLKLVMISSIPIFLILIEPNNGTAAVIGTALIVLCWLTQLPFKYWATPLIVFASLGGFFAYQLPYVAGRLNVYLHPELDLKGKGHQPHQAKIAAGSGKLWGRGPGNGLQKLSYLPEAQNDYIAAIYAEEFGFLGILTLILLYMLVACLGFYIANNSPDLTGFYLASSITFLITFQAFLNLGVVSGLLPSTGLNLPWFSQGGSSLIANVMGIGVLLKISKASKYPDFEHPSLLRGLEK